MAKKSTWIKGAAAVGLVAFGLTQCEGDDPYPDMAIAFNKHGAGNAARHMNIDTARNTALENCNDRPHAPGQSGCTIRFAFEGTTQQCISYGMYINPQGRMTYTALPYNIGGNSDLALDTCNQDDANVCQRQQFSYICN